MNRDDEARRASVLREAALTSLEKDEERSERWLSQRLQQVVVDGRPVPKGVVPEGADRSTTSTIAAVARDLRRLEATLRQLRPADACDITRATYALQAADSLDRLATCLETLADLEFSSGKAEKDVRKTSVRTSSGHLFRARSPKTPVKRRSPPWHVACCSALARN
ncbi:MAG: hypothetical protein AAF604_03380 [Acidobacteriota bacterium]